MVDREEFERWLREAATALRGARVQADAGLHNWACFQAEQAAQLALKALLHGLGRAPWGHDVVRLLDAAADGGVDVPTAVRDAARRVGRHYIPARYPDAHASGSAGEHYGESDAREAIGDAEAVVSFAERAWERLG